MRNGWRWALWLYEILFSFYGKNSLFFPMPLVIQDLSFSLCALFFKICLWVWIEYVLFVSILPWSRPCLCFQPSAASQRQERARSRFLLLVSKLRCWSVVQDSCAGAKLAARFLPLGFSTSCGFPLRVAFLRNFFSRCPLLFSVWRLAVQSPVLVPCAWGLLLKCNTPCL
jgi:hypothetical protein